MTWQPCKECTVRFSVRLPTTLSTSSKANSSKMESRPFLWVRTTSFLEAVHSEIQSTFMESLFSLVMTPRLWWTVWQQSTSSQVSRNTPTTLSLSFCWLSSFLPPLVPLLELFGLSSMVWQRNLQTVYMRSLKTVFASQLTTSTILLSSNEDGSLSTCSWQEHGSSCLPTSYQSVFLSPSIWSNYTKDSSWVGTSSCMTRKRTWRCVLRPSTSTRSSAKSSTSSQTKLVPSLAT